MDLEKFTQPASEKVLYHNYFNSSRYKEENLGSELDKDAFEPSRSVTWSFYMSSIEI